MTLRALEEMQRDDLQVVLINSPGKIETSAHLYKFDSVHGCARSNVTIGDDWMDVGGGKIHMSQKIFRTAITGSTLFWNVLANLMSVKNVPDIWRLVRLGFWFLPRAKMSMQPSFTG